MYKDICIDLYSWQLATLCFHAELSVICDISLLQCVTCYRLAQPWSQHLLLVTGHWVTDCSHYWPSTCPPRCLPIMCHYNAWLTSVPCVCVIMLTVGLLALCKCPCLASELHSLFNSAIVHLYSADYMSLGAPAFTALMLMIEHQQEHVPLQ